MDRLIIFGIDGPASRVAMEAERSGRFEVVAFVTQTPGSAPTFLGRPVLDPAAARATFEPASTHAFASCDARFLNQDRLSLYLSAKQSGYPIASIVSPSALIAPGVRLRENVFVDAGARVLDGANVGANVWVLAQALVGSRAKLGSSCWIGESCAVGDDATLGKNCTIAARAEVAPGVSLPAWSFINRTTSVAVSPRNTIFLDPLFPGGAVIRGGRS